MDCRFKPKSYGKGSISILFLFIRKSISISILGHAIEAPSFISNISGFMELLKRVDEPLWTVLIEQQSLMPQVILQGGTKDYNYRGCPSVRVLASTCACAFSACAQ